MSETIEPDDESWSEVILTLAISTATSAVFLTIYEVARRNPTLIEVFDRRRATMPNRTPAPLLRNSIFEWLFVSNDPNYSEYSDLAHMRDVIREKRKQRNPKRQGCFSSWCSRSNKKEDGRNNDDDVGNDHNDDDGDSAERGVIYDAPSQAQLPRRSLDNFINANSNSIEVDLGLRIQDNIQKGKVKSIRSGTSSSKRSRYSHSTGNSSARQSHKKIVIRRHLTPDVIDVNGWRLPKEVGEYALANDLSEDQLYDYEERLLEQERKDEIDFQKRRAVMASKLNGWMKQRYSGDIRHQLPDATLEELETDVHLRLPPRISRFWYFGFQHSIVEIPEDSDSFARPSSAATTESQKKARLGKSVAIFRNILGSRYKLNTGIDFEEGDENVHLNRHLKSVSVLRKRPLSKSDTELLRSIGLDTFVMIRFLRLCFDITFFPFIAACIILIPSYRFSEFLGEEREIEDGTLVQTQTEGYFLYTINRLNPSSKMLWICWGYSFFYIIYILRRLWIEWETFLPLRFDFLANGDVVENEKTTDHKSKLRSVPAPEKDVQLHLEQYRNSCIVEFIPDSHRRDQELYQFFDALFPGQVKRAEILLNANELTKLIKRRNSFIEQYERVYAKFSYDKRKYWQIKEGNYNELEKSCWDCFNCQSCRGGPKKPADPTIRLGKSGVFCCDKKAVKALPHFLAEIKNLNRRIESEYKKVTEEKSSVEDRVVHNDLIHNTVGAAKTLITGEGSDLKCDTGFVEFMNLTAKQSALQCNITGTNGFMVMTSAPDPRDIIWDNATVEKQSIVIKNSQIGLVLFTSTLFWFAVVGFVTSLSDLNRIEEQQFLPDWFFPEKDTILYDLLEGYLPVVLLEALMLVVPVILKIFAKKVIRLKTHSEIDQFVYKWHFAYRITNLISIIVRQQALKTLGLFLNNPSSTIGYLTDSITLSSQFFLNNMLVSAGSETLFELSQIIQICRHIIMNKFITLEATSKRDLEKIQEPISLEWGETIPPFIFALLVASIYSTVVPIVMGACALYFYIAAKVYTHQALYVYAQPYEGGGKLMYLLNRSVFGIVYISICFFATILGLKDAGISSAVGFLLLMLIITYVVDTWITTIFVNPSSTLALTNARIIDEETKKQNERKRLYREFKNAKRLKRKEEENAKRRFPSSQKENYLPNSFLPPLIESKSTESSTIGSRSERGDKILANRVRLRKARNSRPSSGLSARSESSDAAEEVTAPEERKVEFYLYRQPQLNKTLWETKPRMGNW